MAEKPNKPPSCTAKLNTLEHEARAGSPMLGLVTRGKRTASPQRRQGSNLNSRSSVNSHTAILSSHEIKRRASKIHTSLTADNVCANVVFKGLTGISLQDLRKIERCYHQQFELQLREHLVAKLDNSQLDRLIFEIFGGDVALINQQIVMLVENNRSQAILQVLSDVAPALRDSVGRAFQLRYGKPLMNALDGMEEIPRSKVLNLMKRWNPDELDSPLMSMIEQIAGNSGG